MQRAWFSSFTVDGQPNNIITKEHKMYNANDLRNVLDQLSAKSRTFAEDLLRADKSYGLSEKQAYWVNKLVEQVKAPAPVARTVSNVVNIIGMFAHAKESGKKLPVIRLGDFKLSLASDASKNAGCVYVKDAVGMYIGKITPTGELICLRELGDSLKDSAAAAVTTFAADPLAAAKAYGQSFHSCCFCGIKLTDKKAGGSIEMGYGPICAEKFGLAHSVKANFRAEAA
jgi:hypothetical protein